MVLQGFSCSLTNEIAHNTMIFRVHAEQYHQMNTWRAFVGMRLNLVLDEATQMAFHTTIPPRLDLVSSYKW
jgi:hypothetical protein